MEGRQRVTLYDQLTAGNSSNNRDSLASLMLDDVVFKNRSRTLQDIICEDQPNNNNNNAKDHRKPWKAFKNKLRLKRATVNNNDSDASTQHNSDPQQQPQNDVVQEDVNGSDLIIRYGSPMAGGESNNHRATAAVSLMHLLEETEQEMDLCMESDDDNDGDDVEECEKEEEEEEEGSGGRGVGEYNCCVCMVRHKGAAFIPCGHTFCRMCSREIWVNRGNCPLCNNLILEILDIF